MKHIDLSANNHPLKQSKIGKSSNLLADIRHLIEESRQNVARQVNSAMSLLYWNIGPRIRTEVLNNQRAEYGKQIVATLAIFNGEKINPITQY